MRTDPFTDTLMSLIGQHPDQQTLGLFNRFFLTLFWALLIGGVLIAIRNWRADASQRSTAHLWTWLARTMAEAMWFQASLWKLPFPQSPGFLDWISQIIEHAAFGWHRAWRQRCWCHSSTADARRLAHDRNRRTSPIRATPHNIDGVPGGALRDYTSPRPMPDARCAGRCRGAPTPLSHGRATEGCGEV